MSQEEFAEHEINEDWEIARTVSTAIEAELMAGRLRSYGIPAVVLSQVDTTRNFTIGDLAIAKIFVPKSEKDRAIEILSTDAELTDSDLEDIDQ